MQRRRFVILVSAVLLSVLGRPSAGAPAAELWERWLAHDASATDRVDHGAWNDFLEAHLVSGADGVVRIRYGAVSQSSERSLAAYVASLGSVPISRYQRNEQMAYWINLYNALTLSVVLEHYPVDTIRDISISPGLFSSGPWGKKLIEVEGEPLSLDDIEHRILRPIWRDPRIHYAVNCASIGCPNLQPRAFTAQNLERALEAAAREFVNHPRAVRIEDDQVVASKIYDWFQSDFGDREAEVLAHLRRYAEAPLIAALDARRSIARYEYDWGLNVAR